MANRISYFGTPIWLGNHAGSSALRLALGHGGGSGCFASWACLLIGPDCPG